MDIRRERHGDEEAIHALTLAAFEPMTFSNGSEAAIIRALRASGDLTVSLVADDDGAIVGHVAFSPVMIGDAVEGWFGLGPISVAPDRQRRGIGKALIRDGLGILREDGAPGCALIGNPAYYSRIGFASDGRLSYGDLDLRYVQWIAFAEPPPRGALHFSPAFDVGPD